MNRRNALHTLTALAALPWLPACSRAPDTGAAAAAPDAKTASSKIARLNKPAAAWREVTRIEPFIAALGASPHVS